MNTTGRNPGWMQPQDYEDRKADRMERMLDEADYRRDERKDRELDAAMARDEAAAKQRAIPRPPRYFKGTGESAGSEWKWSQGTVWTKDAGEWTESIFVSARELTDCLDVVECDSDGNELASEPDPDREYQIRKDNES